MNFSRPFIRRPIGTTLLAIGLFLIGIVGYQFLPVASLPSVEFPTISVSANRPGADPNMMAATVAAPLERRLGEIAGVTELTSVSSLGNSRIVVQFDLIAQHRGRRPRRAGRAQRRAQRPADRHADAADLPQIQSVRVADPDPGAHLQDACSRARSTTPPTASSRSAWRRCEGVADVTVAGSEQPAIRVRVDPGRLATMGLTLEDVRTAIANSNAAGPLGAFDGAERAAPPSASTTSCARPAITIRWWSRRSTARSSA